MPAIAGHWFLIFVRVTFVSRGFLVRLFLCGVIPHRQSVKFLRRLFCAAHAAIFLGCRHLAATRATASRYRSSICTVGVGGRERPGRCLLWGPRGFAAKACRGGGLL